MSLTTFKHALEYINRIGNTFWSFFLRNWSIACVILFWRMSLFQELFMCTLYIYKPRICRQGVLRHNFTGNFLIEDGTWCNTNLNSHFTERNVGLLSGCALAHCTPIVHCIIAWGLFVLCLYIVNIGELYYMKSLNILWVWMQILITHQFFSCFNNLQTKISNQSKMSL